MRISRPQMFMQIARVVAQRSTCFRLNVGAVVVVGNRIVSIGYNGSPPGAPHCSGNDCPGRFHCTQTIHAERNALNYVSESLKDRWKDLYVTHSPCYACTNLLSSHKVHRVFYELPYRESSHLHTIEHLYRVTPAGWVIDDHTQEVVEDFT